MSNAIWYPTKIPQHAYFFWGNDVLPWVRYLTLHTFRALNPTWKVTLFTRWDQTTTKVVTNRFNYWPWVEKLGVVVERMSIEPAFGIDLSYLDSLADRDVCRSDYLRWYLLSESGGLWADMDILFVKPLTSAPWNTLENCNKDACLLPSPYNNFLLSAPHSESFDRLWEKAKDINPDDVIRDSYHTGPIHYEHVRAAYAFLTAIEMPLATTEIADENGEWFGEDTELLVPWSTLGIHWHGSGRLAKYTELTPRTYKRTHTLLAQCIDYALERLPEESF